MLLAARFLKTVRVAEDRLGLDSGRSSSSALALDESLARPVVDGSLGSSADLGDVPAGVALGRAVQLYGNRK